MEPRSLSAEITSELARRNVDHDLRRALADVAGRVHVAACGDGASLPLSATHDSYTAVFVWKHRFSIALDPAAARRLGDRHGASVEAKTGNTHYVQFSSDDLKRPGIYDLVVETLVLAFGRASRGPTWTRGKEVRAARQAERCPLHHMEKSVSGVCPMCDD